jgi:nitrilase
MKVAIAQFRPVHLDLPACLSKAETIIADASRNNVDLLVFGETWFCGYPAWLDHCPNVGQWNYDPMKDMFALMYENAIEINGQAFVQLSQMAREYKVCLCIGATERVVKGRGNGTLYNTIFVFSNKGELLLHHRKLVPTFSEKLIYGYGDGAGLHSVETPFGKIGASICWEHWMPLTRQTLHDAGELVHIALWPSLVPVHELASRHYAFEGRCFVLAAASIMHVEDIPGILPLPQYLSSEKKGHQILRGGSCIIAPTGEFITEPLFGEERLVISDLDVSMQKREQMTLDCSGHYQRPDVFEFSVNRIRK